MCSLVASVYGATDAIAGAAMIAGHIAAYLATKRQKHIK